MAWMPFALAGFLGAMALTPLFVALMRRSGLGQPIREYGPTLHEHKRGTPTMGGAAVLIVFAAVLLVYQAVRGPLGAGGLLLVGATFGFGLVGLLDDLLKFLEQRSYGLSARRKLLLQLLVAGGLLAALDRWGLLEDSLKLPFSTIWEAGAALAALIALLTLLGTVNALNLTDGLDGLAAGTTLILLAAYALITSRIPGELFPLILLFGAVLLGFLPFNLHPAKIFLGDTGALTLGGFVGALSVLTGTELILAILAAVPAAEVLSVIVQVASFKLTGRRVFKVSPLHHHFERAEGVEYPHLLPAAEWPEWAITLIFWGVSALFALLGLWAYF